SCEMKLPLRGSLKRDRPIKTCKVDLMYCMDAFSQKNYLSSQLDFASFYGPLSQIELLIRNFISQKGVFKPILRNEITSEGLSQARSTHKNLQSRVQVFNIYVDFFV